VSFTGPYRRKK